MWSSLIWDLTRQPELSFVGGFISYKPLDKNNNYTCIYMYVYVSIYMYLYVHVHSISHMHEYKQGSPFGSLWCSIMSIVVYTVGGPDNMVFQNSGLGQMKSDLVYSVISYFLWIVFTVTMSILFLNLLVRVFSFTYCESRAQIWHCGTALILVSMEKNLRVPSRSS